MNSSFKYLIWRAGCCYSSLSHQVGAATSVKLRSFSFCLTGKNADKITQLADQINDQKHRGWGCDIRSKALHEAPEDLDLGLGSDFTSLSGNQGWSGLSDFISTVPHLAQSIPTTLPSLLFLPQPRWRGVLSCLLSVFPASKCELHKSRSFVLFTVIPSEPTTVSGTEEGLNKNLLNE